MGNLEDSCNGERACYKMAKYGSVGNLVASCDGEGACFDMANYGTVGDVVNSCNGDGEEFPHSFECALFISLNQP